MDNNVVLSKIPVQHGKAELDYILVLVTGACLAKKGGKITFTLLSDTSDISDICSCKELNCV